jgi:hypothetical protein
METGWTAAELPAAREARELAEILTADPSFAERQAERFEQARRDEQQERAAEDREAAETRAWLGRMRGEQLPGVGEVLARARGDAGLPGGSDPQRRRMAREILARHGLEDQIDGGWSGTVFDANLGCLEPARDAVQRSADGEDAELGRLVKRNREDGEYIRSLSRSRSPFARRSVAVRSEPVTCPGCIAVGASAEESFLIHHSDADGQPLAAVPDVPPDDTDRRAAEAQRLMELGYSWESAHLAAIPYGEAVR